jgi:hypothetical protein
MIATFDSTPIKSKSSDANSESLARERNAIKINNGGIDLESFPRKKCSET